MTYSEIQILLIEDNQGDARIIKELLREAGDFHFRLWNAENLLDGFKLIEEREFDVILLDLKLPDSDGFETILRTKEKVRNIPIIVLTGLNDEVLAIKTVQTGAQDYLIKGQIDTNPLIRAIFHSIERNKMYLTMVSLVKSLQKNEARFRKIIEENADSIIIVDKLGKVKFLNPAAERYLGKRYSDFLGQFFKVPTVDGEKTEISIIQKNGNILIGEIQAVKIEWDGYTAYLLTVRDISERKNFEKKLKESEKKYRDLFENSPYPILIVNMDGIIIDCNSILEDLIGYNKNEIIDRNFENSTLILKKDLALINEIFETLHEGNIPKPVQIEIQRKYKEFIWAKLRFSLMSLGKEMLIHILIQDITEIKQSELEVRKLEQTLHEMNALIENAPLAIFLIHQKGKILRVNEEAVNLFGYLEEDLLNLKIYDLFDSKFKEIIRDHYNKDIFNLLIPNKLEAKIKSKGGKTLNVEITSTILKIADNLIIQSFFSDITDRIHSGKHRKLLLDQLIASLEFKSKFLANMSHELRTPLNAILGFSQLLLEESYGSITLEQKDFLNDINSAGSHLLTLINSLLDLTKIEAGKVGLSIEKFKLKDMVDEIKSTINPLYSNKDLTFFLEGINNNDFIVGDPFKFKQILYNLLSNAIKFTEKGTIKLRGIERSDHWEFQVIDTGIGIDKNDYDVVFREFGRVEDDKVKKVSGSGLGLAITKRLIQLHGGEVWFESEVGKGTIFYFTIPKLKITN